jgi:RND family efflux transporter MFP subunit
MIRSNRILGVKTVSCILCLLVDAGCAGKKPITVRETTVHYGTLRTVIPETGMVQLPSVVTVPATVTGNIESIYTRAGARVTRGQPLVRLTEIGHAPAERRLSAEAALSKATVELRESERSYHSDMYLYEQKGIARDALMQSQARLQQARISYQEARKELHLLQDDEHLVRAPFGGIVESMAQHAGDELRPMEQGDPIVAGQPLFTIATHEDFVVRAKIDEQDLFTIKLGQRVIVGGEDLGENNLSGRVIALAPVVQRSDDPSNTARHALATIRLDKRLPFLRDGMTVDVDIITHNERHVLTIPSDAVRRDAHGAHVLVVRNNHAFPVNVRLGTRNDTEIVVRSGLHDGDTIVADKDANIASDAVLIPAPHPTL